MLLEYKLKIVGLIEKKVLFKKAFFIENIKFTKKVFIFYLMDSFRVVSHNLANNLPFVLDTNLIFVP